jgi:uncharacterized protein (TIRG00374 family)
VNNTKGDHSVHPARQVLRQCSWKLVPMFLVTGFIIALLLTKLTDAQHLLDALSTAQWPWLAAELIAVTAVFMVVSVRFSIMLRAVGYDVNGREAFDAIISTFPFALITPSRANDLLRALMLRGKVPIWECSGTVIVERLIDIQSISLVGIAGCLLIGESGWILVPFTILIAKWSGIILMLRHADWLVSLPIIRRVEDKVRRLLEVIHVLQNRPQILIQIAIISIFVWITVICCVLLLLKLFGSDLPLMLVMAYWPIAIFVGLLPMTIAGLGTRDAAFAFLVTLTQPSANMAPVVLATLGYSVTTLILPAFIGLPFMARHIQKIFALTSCEKDDTFSKI